MKLWAATLRNGNLKWNHVFWYFSRTTRGIKWIFCWLQLEQSRTAVVFTSLSELIPVSQDSADVKLSLNNNRNDRWLKIESWRSCLPAWCCELPRWIIHAVFHLRMLDRPAVHRSKWNAWRPAEFRVTKYWHRLIHGAINTIQAPDLFFKSQISGISTRWVDNPLNSRILWRKTRFSCV